MIKPEIILRRWAHGKRALARAIISLSLDNKLVIIIVKFRPSALELFWNPLTWRKKCKIGYVYCIKDFQEIEKGTSYLTTTRPWNGNIFYAMAGKDDLLPMVCEAYNQRNYPKDKWERLEAKLWFSFGPNDGDIEVIRFPMASGIDISPLKKFV